MAATWHDAEDRASSGGDQPSPERGASPTDLPDDPDRAITELYAAHWHRLVRLAWLLLHDQGAAEDAVQDAFVATHRNWRSIRQTGGAVGYLQTAVVNTCRSVQRTRSSSTGNERGMSALGTFRAGGAPTAPRPRCSMPPSEAR